MSLFSNQMLILKCIFPIKILEGFKIWKFLNRLFIKVIYGNICSPEQESVERK